LLFGIILSATAPAPASAEWHTTPLKWLETYISGTSVVMRDTVSDVIAAGQADTVWSFSIAPLDITNRGVGLPAGQTSVIGDTTVVAWLVFQADSNAAITPTLSSLTVLFDGRINPVKSVATNPNSGWVKADSALVNGAAGGTLIVGNECVAVPIRSVTPYGSIFRFQSLRARITAATGVLTAARVYLRYWTN